MRANLKQLTATSKSRNFTALEGVRVLCMLWVIVGHTANFMEFLGFDEPLQTVERRLLDSPAFQVGAACTPRRVLGRLLVR